MESEKLHLLADVSVVSLCQFFLALNMRIQVLLLWEGNTVDSLEIVIRVLSEPVSGRVLLDLECFHVSSIGQVRSRAEIDKLAALVRSGHAVFGDLICDQLHFERVMLEELESLRFGEDNTLEDLLFTDNLREGFLDIRVIILRDLLVANVRVVEESVLQGWSNT